MQAQVKIGIMIPSNVIVQ
ncbi:hypothetical protein [uncultured Algoriphagus sp.]